MRGIPVVCLALLLAGCSPRIGPVPDQPEGDNRFPHGSIGQTIAPWDGLATQLLLTDQRPNGKPAGPHVALYVYRAPSDLSGQRVRLGGKETRQGLAQWVADGKSKPISRAEVTFGEVKADAPVEGNYDVDLPDGTRARGSFRAQWLPREGRGG